MSDVSLVSGGRRWPARLAPRLGFGLAALAVALLVGAPLGYRLGLWDYRFGLLTLLPDGFYAAVAAFAVSLLALAWWGGMGRAGRVMALLGLVVGGAFLYQAWQLNAARHAYPPIDDITTDAADPPAFSMVLPARAAEKSNAVAYNPATAKAQQAAYPDIAPATTALPPAEAFKRALAAAQGMPGWRIVAADPATGRIEASQSSFWFGFTDDMVIRVKREETGSRIDIRSESRHGRGDFGVNANRIRAYLAALKRQLG